MEKKDLNRLKLMLVIKKKTNKWLADKMGKDPGTVSKWCTNTTQPDIANLMKIAALLQVNVADLLNPDAIKEDENE